MKKETKEPVARKLSDEERTMTVECKSCGHEYGAWRSHCPACGQSMTLAQHNKVNKAVAPVRVKKAKRKDIKKHTDECILCRRRAKAGKKNTTTCPHCNEPVHKACLEHHRQPCLTFQLEVEAMTRKVATK